MSIDIDAFTKYLREHAAGGWGKGRCGEYVRKPLQAGGAKIPMPYPASGKLYGSALLRLGFHQIMVNSPNTFDFMKGDVMVMEPYKENGAGHVAGYDGRNWISDFIQRDFWAGPVYRTKRPNYAVYRY